ncbi:MAG: SWIM zinc finger domain-containing protein [Planctomycetes bacterium]|nr:SWIM zinc finger domain-containing protein [Planctomycetota bacterium]
MGSALAYSYRYLYESQLAELKNSAELQLATCNLDESHPYFFRGRLMSPGRTARMLRGLMRVVQSRFHVPPGMLARILAAADPVVTAGDDRLRFEAFSACCSTYARLDLLPNAMEGDIHGRGTTNVDFNRPMLTALTKIRDHDDVGLAVGVDEVSLERNEQSVVEKRVSLPIRWLKGFVEVQACQRKMSLVDEVSGVEAVRFVRSLPRMATHRRETWVVRTGRSLRISQQRAAGGVRVGGLQRLRILEQLAADAGSLRVYAENETSTSGWELVLGDARFFLVLSPETWRGFSGEGAVLEDLATDAWTECLAKVRACLTWENVIDNATLARQTQLSDKEIAAALAALGARGLVGFDLSTSSYFHRVLPFDLSLVESLQPRLTAARKLVAQGKVRLDDSDTDHVVAYVAGSDVEHRVRIEDQDTKCTCTWFAKHRGKQGPCKHILAAQILLDKRDDPQANKQGDHDE